jgi:UPF0716 protein FxsA
MALILLALFIGIPLLEVAVFIQVGGVLGVWPTIAIVLGTAFLGASLLRLQGLQTWRRAEEAMRRGEPPVAEMLDGVFLFIAALLMVTPGLFTDAIGILFLIPPVRRAIGRYAARRLAESSRFHVHTSGMGGMGGMGPGGPARPPKGPGPVIEGEAEEIGEEPRGSGSERDSPWRQ